MFLIPAIGNIQDIGHDHVVELCQTALKKFYFDQLVARI